MDARLLVDNAIALLKPGMMDSDGIRRIRTQHSFASLHARVSALVKQMLLSHVNAIVHDDGEPMSFSWSETTETSGWTKALSEHTIETPAQQLAVKLIQRRTLTLYIIKTHILGDDFFQQMRIACREARPSMGQVFMIHFSLGQHQKIENIRSTSSISSTSTGYRITGLGGFCA